MINRARPANYLEHLIQEAEDTGNYNIFEYAAGRELASGKIDNAIGVMKLADSANTRKSRRAAGLNKTQLMKKNNALIQALEHNKEEILNALEDLKERGWSAQFRNIALRRYAEPDRHLVLTEKTAEKRGTQKPGRIDYIKEYFRVIEHPEAFEEYSKQYIQADNNKVIEEIANTLMAHGINEEHAKALAGFIHRPSFYIHLNEK